MAWTSARKPSGPHQDSNPSLVVHRSQSSSTVARYVRSMTAFGLVAAASALLLFALMCLAPAEGPSVSCVAFREHLPDDRGELPRVCGTALGVLFAFPPLRLPDDPHPGLVGQRFLGSSSADLR